MDTRETQGTANAPASVLCDVLGNARTALTAIDNSQDFKYALHAELATWQLVRLASACHLAEGALRIATCKTVALSDYPLLSCTFHVIQVLYACKGNSRRCQMP